MTRIDELQSELSELRARQLSASVSLRKCEPQPPESKVRSKRIYEIAVSRSGGASAVAHEGQCHESTVRYRIEVPTRNVHLEHIYELPAAGISVVIRDLTDAMEAKMGARRAS
jgi:hypothetical protein